MSDLVSGLLAHLDKIEKVAKAARFEPTTIYVDNPEDGLHIRWHDPTSILRLVQAHRQIIEQYKTAEERPALLMADRTHGVEVLKAEVAARVLRTVIETLAEGWGLKEEGKA